MKKEQGITLMILVITIIILIIIAFVSIGTVSNTKIVEDTEILKEKYENFSTNEQQRFESLKEKVLSGM